MSFASSFPKQTRTWLARVNRSVGRVSGYKIAPAPLTGTLNGELHLLMGTLGLDHVLDVGAHRGRFAQSLRKGLGFTGAITSFEPSPAAFATLAVSAKTDPRWEVRNVALGSTDGEASLNEFQADEMNSLRSLGPYAQDFAPSLHPIENRTVEVMRLDSIWSGLGANEGHVLLKTDTQGFDLEVVRGAGYHLAKIPAVVMEVAVRPLYGGAPVISEVLDEMDKLGFELTGAFPIHRYSNGLRVIEFDCTFVNSALCMARSETPHG